MVKIGTMRFILGTLLMLCSIVCSACALSIAFADSTLQGEHQALIIAPNGTIVWEGNTSSTAQINTSDFEDPINSTVIVHIKPEAKNILESPATLMDEIGSQVERNLIPLIFIGIIGLVLLGRRR